ncbi:MAG TPA: hypothetical protein DIU00_18555 [Phycisphaerales bacterium]|nr:hypothetical protein [Phycisphaerales bacterium]
MKDIISIAAAILGSVGAAGAIILGLSNWLGKVWANRLFEKDKLIASKKMEATRRKRDVYSKLAVNMRVFLASHDITKDDRRIKFLNTYDEAFLWASDEVIEQVGRFLDLIEKDTSKPSSVPMSAKRETYAKCLIIMRKDVGYPKTSANYRIVSF